MTNLIIKKFIKNYEDTANPKVRAAYGKLAGFVGILCNVILFGAKITIGTIAASVSITADAVNNLSDATSSIISLVGFKLAERPADEDHPYGHARYEYLSGLAVAALIIVIGFELAKTSFNKILHPVAVALTPVLILVLAGSILIKLWLFFFNRYLGKRIHSDALLATAADSRNDVVSTGMVLMALIAEHYLPIQIDGYVGLGVAVFILVSGVMIAKQTISPLLGETASPELREVIIKTVQSEPKILGYHDLMVHDYGPGQRFASIHVEMDEKESALECHELIDQLERICLKEHQVHLVIHYDPVVTNDPELDRLRELVQKILHSYHKRISIHDFRMVQGKDNTNLIFDAVLPADMMKQQKEVKKHLDDALNKESNITYHTVITFDMGSFNELE